MCTTAVPPGAGHQCIVVGVVVVVILPDYDINRFAIATRWRASSAANRWRGIGRGARGRRRYPRGATEQTGRQTRAPVMRVAYSQPVAAHRSVCGGAAPAGCDGCISPAVAVFVFVVAVVVVVVARVAVEIAVVVVAIVIAVVVAVVGHVASTVGSGSAPFAGQTLVASACVRAPLRAMNRNRPPL